MELHSARNTDSTTFDDHPTFHTKTSEYQQSSLMAKNSSKGTFGRGRDNSMYHISDGFNLKDNNRNQKNAFQTLVNTTMMLNNQSSEMRSMT